MHGKVVNTDVNIVEYKNLNHGNDHVNGIKIKGRGYNLSIEYSFSFVNCTLGNSVTRGTRNDPDTVKSLGNTVFRKGK